MVLQLQLQEAMSPCWTNISALVGGPQGAVPGAAAAAYLAVALAAVCATLACDVSLCCVVLLDCAVCSLLESVVMAL